MEATVTTVPDSNQASFAPEEKTSPGVGGKMGTTMNPKKAKKHWPKAEWILGNGNIALLAHCGVLTVTLWTDEEEAMHSCPASYFFPSGISVITLSVISAISIQWTVRPTTFFRSAKSLSSHFRT
jgi:hypothetical protein